MRVIYESNPRSVEDWLSEIRQGRLMLPRFQRMEAWSANQVRELMQSIVEGLPVGAMLLLEARGEPQFACRPLKCAPGKSSEPVNELLLDGQQRLTALWRVLHDNYARDRFMLQITDTDNSLSEEDLPQVHRVRQFARNGKMYPLWVRREQDTYRRGMIPMSLLDPQNERRVKDWVFKATEDPGERWDLNGEIQSMRDHVKSCQIPYIRLTSKTPLHAVLATFTKVNTQGTPLSAYDLVVAQMEKYDIDMHQRVQDLWENAPALQSFPSLDEVDILRSLALLEGKNPTRRQILDLDPDHLKLRWDTLEEGVTRALSFLNEEGIVHESVLPTGAVLPALFALWTEVPHGGFGEGNARTLLRNYIWWSFFSDRYERAVNTMVHQDYRALRQRLNGDPDIDLPFRKANLPEDRHDLRDAGWPKRKDRLARAILALTLRAGARDIHDGSVISSRNIRSREYHHLFPKAFLRKKGILKEGADLALNVALVTWRTNRKISATSPAKYLMKAADQVLGEEELSDRLASHYIPVEPFMQEDYEEFLSQRSQLVLDRMHELVDDTGDA